MITMHAFSTLYQLKCFCCFNNYSFCRGVTQRWQDLEGFSSFWFVYLYACMYITYLLFIYFIVIVEVVLEMRGGRTGGRAGGLASVCGTGLKLLKALNLNLGKK